MNKNLKKEIARDIIALGSIPFYLIVIIRALIKPYIPFAYYLIIGFVILFILSKVIKNSNWYAARGFLLFVFTSFFYGSVLYAVFACLLWLMIIFSLRHLKVESKEVLKGTLLGLVSALVSHFLIYLIN